MLVRDKRKGKPGNERPESAFTLVSTFPVSCLTKHFETWLQVIGAPHKVKTVHSGLPHRYLLEQRHGLAARNGGIHLVMFRLDDWNNFAGDSDSDEDIHPCSRDLVERNLHLTLESLDAVMSFLTGSLVLVVCPLSKNHRKRRGVREYFHGVHARLQEAINEYPQCALLHAEDVAPEDELDVAECGESVSQYADGFLERLSRRIMQIAYALESRPCCALAVSPSHSVDRADLEWREFVSLQWHRGRQVALLSQNEALPWDEGFATVDCSPVPAWAKIAEIRHKLLAPEQDLMFLGNATECLEVQARFPQVLSLPVFEKQLNVLSVLRELWCLQPISETWLTERDVRKPTLPRLSSRLLMELAAHPEWRADAFISNVQRSFAE